MRSMLSTETEKILDDLTLDFLTERDLIDISIIRMGVKEFSALRKRLTAYLFSRTNLTQDILAEYMDYASSRSVSHAISSTYKRVDKS